MKMPDSFTAIAFVALFLVALISPAQDSASQISGELSKKDILERSSVKGGLFVHLGPKNARLLLQVSEDPRFVCQGLTRDSSLRQRLLEELSATRDYGRCSANTLNQVNLPYADNLVRILVVEASCGVEESELWRVLCPGGLLFKKTEEGWRHELKKRPAQMDEWTHARHGADGNFVSKDEFVGEPTNNPI